MEEYYLVSEILAHIGSLKILKKENPNLIIAICGCMAQMENSQQIIKEANYMPGAKMILKMLKEEGNELIIVTARRIEDEKETTEKRLKEDDMNIFSKSYFSANNKAEVCQKENIDIMIDDSKRNCKMVSESGIKTYMMDSRTNKGLIDEKIERVYSWPHLYMKLKEI